MRIDYSHAFFCALDLYSESRIIPIEITFIGDTAVVSGFFKKDFEESTEIKKGDIILKINNISIDSMINERKKYMPESNRGALLRDMASELLQTNKESLTIEFLDDSVVKQTELASYKKSSISIPSKFNKNDTCFELIEPNISYLYLGTLKRECLPDLWSEIEKTEGLIIDLRCYPQEVCIGYIGINLMDSNILFTKASAGSIAHPGTFEYAMTVTIAHAQSANDCQKNEQPYEGKVAILINELTQSHAEFSAMAYRNASKAKVFGSPTAGADGNISEIYLPGGLRTTIALLK